VERTRAKSWQWEVNLIGSKQINAWCMPGGKIAFYTGILDQLKLTDDEAAMIMGHEMAHALREHARERLAKSTATDMGLRLGAQLLGLGQVGDWRPGLGSQLLTLKYSRDDETEADLVGLEMAARAGYQPEAASACGRRWAANGGSGPPGFLSTHPSGPDRIRSWRPTCPRCGAVRAARAEFLGSASPQVPPTNGFSCARARTCFPARGRG
jgi:Zn-dependent protease with chaperone function